jgi:F0F1-type ATP synthase membrane subunit c/vacuolar-type H+-ATPase subunit K
MQALFIISVILATVVVPSGVIGLIAFASIRALGRNPTAAPKILLAMIISLVFTESVAIIALLIIFQVFSK